MRARTYSRDAVAKHKTEEDLWVIIDHKVYDLSDFYDAHPGGGVVLRQVAGQDATKAFYNLHRHEVLQQYSDFCIGTVENEKPEVIDPQPGDLSQVPYAEPLWLTPQYKSPYFKDSHRRLQKAMRTFMDEHVIPEAVVKEKDGTYISDELCAKFVDTNVLACRLGPGEHLHNRKILGGVVDGKEFDYFHDMIVNQELARTMSRGFQDGAYAGMTISLSAVKQWLNDKALREKITEEVLSGKKKICLAVTEAFAGSDVAGLQCTAELSEDGSHYIVNGTKKWITNGVFCDYFVTACKTPQGGLTVLLIERQEGVETKLIKTSYSTAAGTTYIEYDNVKVPRNHLLGQENKGIQVVLSNFNHERWMMVCMTVRWCRTATEECLKWGSQRLVFGKPLIEQPVIRAKIAKMISHTEAAQAWLETITYQMNNMTYAQQSKLLGGPIGLLKSHVTRSAHELADEAVNIFGGRALTQSGMGKHIEAFHRTYKFDSILGGTEEILADLGVRQALRNMPKAML